MEPSEIAKLDLALAWQRMKLDRPDRAFYTHPRLIEWIEFDLEGWFASIRQRLWEGYVPHPSLTCSVPKPGWLIRPGTVLDEQDELVFNALVGSLYQRAFELLGPFQGDPDIAYQIQSNASNKEWIRTGFRVWAEWRTKSIQNLKGAQFVVFADIAGFYENIDLQRISSDLKPLSLDAPLLGLLMSLLNRWAQPRGKGIPQGFSAADILAKIYLNPIDLALRNGGFTHLRYVDDIRIFCRTRLEAKRGLLLLNDLMRKRGLNLQSAKTKILRADEAAQEIDGVTPLIEAIQSELLTEMRESFSSVPSSVSVSDIQRFFQERPSGPRPEVLEQAFQDNFGSTVERFNKTLLHFLLTRLAKAKSKIAVSYAIELIQQRPEETETALRYLLEVGVGEVEDDRILDYISSAEAIYDYQTFQIVSWFATRRSISPRLLHLCRAWSADKNRDPWLRMATRSVLGQEGDQSDLEAIEGSYDTILGDLERADVVEALARMETGRRNSFFGRVSSDGDLVGRAVRRVRVGVGAVSALSS
jgi:hypothetical protein